MKRTPTPAPIPAGFTLVEMLVVIAIIGILVALLIPVLGRIMGTGSQTALTVEIDALGKAIEVYKGKHGDYPPDFTSAQALRAHLTAAYPRANANGVAAWLALTPATQKPADLDPSEALVFWLALVRNNPRNPLSGTGEPDVLFTFEQKRLVDRDGDGWLEYIPKYGEAPYVYFDGRLVNGSYNYKDAVWPPKWNVANSVGAKLAADYGVVAAYRSNDAIDAMDGNKTLPKTVDNPTKWIAPGKFQILCAGLDGKFGALLPADPNANTYPVFKQFPNPNYPLTDDDKDNLSSFCEGKNVEDSQP
jgi:prepilin-type N-terminal cleavage/methylation domain-containing protein